jgi:hypothetical protein
VPPIPSKKNTGNLGLKFISNRMKQLQFFLSLIAQKIYFFYENEV